MMSNPKQINVAVVGGGIGGLCVAIGLLQHKHIHVEVYEAAHKFSEIGAGVAFGPNAQRALRLISPETETAYLRQVSHNVWPEMQNTWFEFRFGQGDREGELITAPRNETGQATVHRAKFLQEFVALVPPELCHFGKRLEEVVDHGESKGVELHFKDGTSATADCVIGADGVHSAVRKFLLGAEHPALNPIFTGSVAYRGLIPMAKATEVLGDRYAQNSQIFVGHGGNVMLYPVDRGETLNIVASNSSYKEWTGPWVQKVASSKLHEDFAEWGPTAQKVIQLLDENPDTAAWSLWDLPPAPTYFRGNVVMMGDAAHASTPFQGQGAGQAIEDAYVLQALFAEVDDPKKIAHAFEAYNKIRRPRSLQVVKTSREAGELAALRYPGVMSDAVALKDNIDWRMEWMWHRDIEGERHEAMGCFKKLEAGGSLYS